MNYLYLILAVIVLYYIWDRYDRNNVSGTNNGIMSSYQGESEKIVGFIKPEHKLFKVLNIHHI